MHLFIWILPYQINFSNSGCQYWLKSEIKFLVLALYNLTKKEEFPNIVISGIKDPATCFQTFFYQGEVIEMAGFRWSLNSSKAHWRKI